MTEDAAGELSPIFVFQSVQEAVADARGLAQLVQGDFPEFPLALQTFAELSPGHRTDLFLPNRSGPRAGAAHWPLTDYRRGEKVLSNEGVGRL